MIEILCLLNQAYLDSSDFDSIKRALDAPNFEWLAFLDLMEFNRVSLLSIERIRQLGIEPPPEAIARFHQLEDACAKTLEKSERQAICTEQVLEILGKEGVKVILLKGGMISAAFFGARPYKKMNDIDLLIRRDDAEKAAHALKREGFTSLGNPFGKSEISSSSHHMPPLVSPGLKALVGLHWGLHSPHSPWKSDAKTLWLDASPIVFRRAQAFRMSWENNLLHLCIHLPFYKTGLRELADIANVVLFAGIDWDVVVERASEWKASSAVYRVLKLVSCLYPLQIPESVWRNLRRTTKKFYRKDAERRARPEVLLNSRSVYIAKIEKSAVHLRLGSNFNERFKGWFGTWSMAVLVPPPEVKRMCFDDSFSSRAKAPFGIIRAMCEDHGKFAMTYITAANIGILLKSTLYSSVGLEHLNQTSVNPQFRRLLEELE